MLTFTELLSFPFLLIFPRGGLRHISSISLSVCFGLLCTSGQHLTSEQIGLHKPDSSEPDTGLNWGSERVHTSIKLPAEQRVNKLHAVLWGKNLLIIND